jgi:ribosomal protein L11 methyltransferase
MEVRIPVPDALQELLIADLLDLDFEGFVQEDDLILAFIPPARWNDVARENIERWLEAHHLVPHLVERVIEPQNWNSTWEETIRPVSVPPFLIKPTWASTPPEYQDSILLEIDPKMSFGTGYHESTRLMLRLMPNVVRTGQRVLDAGTGTGVLAIATLKLGASKALGFDIDEWAFDNATENALINGVAERFSVRIGGMEVVSESDFDTILANINLNALIEMLPSFAAKLRPDGVLVMSGVLLTDRPMLRPVIADAGFDVISEAEEGEWWAVVVRRA